MKLMLLVSRLSRLLVACSAAALVARGAVAQTVLRTLAGSTGEKLGAAFANAGDVNGDNWDDYLVGAPNANSGTGIVVCVSGKYLATAIAPATLYSIGPSVPGSAGSKFGSTIAALGDVNADGAIDFAVGAPYHDDTMNGADCGAVFFLNGATHALPSGPLEGTSSAALLGWSLSPAGDMNGDTRGDVIVAAPGGNGGAGYVHLVSGGALAFGATGGAVFMTFGGPLPAAQFGYAVLGDLDLDADGQNDIVVTAPYADQGVADRGFVRMYSGAFGYPQLGQYWGAGACALGRSLAGGADCDGDARPDLVVGAFKSDAGTLAGKAVVLSSSRIIQNTPPFEIYTLAPASVGYGAAQFGASVAVASDLNLDGTADILVGAPGFNTSPVHGFGDGGAIAFFSGATGARLGWYRGADFERLGSATLGALEDFDADGYPDVIVGGSEADAPTSDCGVLKAIRLFPSPPVSYCIGKVNSLGCTPSITWVGFASASSAAAFPVGALNVLNQKNGLLFYGSKPVAVPFQGGVKCVKSPTIRTAVQSSAGSASGNDCSGTLTFDFNAWIQSGVDAQLAAGEEVFCQYWSRDPASPSTTSLSNALSFLINP